MISRDILQKIAEYVSDRNTFYSLSICSKKTNEVCNMMKYYKRKEFNIVECDIAEQNNVLYCEWDGKYTRGMLNTGTDSSDRRCVWFKRIGAQCVASTFFDTQLLIEDTIYFPCITIGDSKLQRLIDELEMKINEPVLCNYTNSSDSLIEIYCENYQYDIEEQILNKELLISYCESECEDTDNDDNNLSSIQSLNSEDISSEDISSEEVYHHSTNIDCIWIVNNKQGIITELKDILYQIKQFGSEIEI
jgi:hypothetical protein